MATKGRSKAASPAQNLSDKQIAKIWSEMKPAVLVERLRAFQPSSKWTATGYQMVGCCPFHDETTPSFRVYVDRGYAKCFSCEEFVSNPITLWSKIRSMGLAEALQDLRHMFGLKFLSNNAARQLKNWERNQLLKRELAVICHEYMVNAIATPTDPVFATAQPAVNWLINTRKLDTGVIHDLDMLGVVPPLSHIYEKLDERAKTENKIRNMIAAETNEKAEKFVSLVEEAKTYLKPLATSTTWTGAVLFRLDLAPDVVGRLKLRKPGSKDMLILDDEYEDGVGFYGLGWKEYKTVVGQMKKYNDRIFVVEGEFDFLTIASQQILAGGPQFMTVAVGSAGGQAIDDLQQFGYETVMLVGDAPHVKGDELMASWLENIHKLKAKMFTGYGAFPAAGDPDEAVNRFGFQVFSTALLDVGNKDIFTNPSDWVFELGREEMGQIDPTDQRLMIETAASRGKLLKNTHESHAYVMLCVNIYGLPEAGLKREIIAREENEPGFILRLVDVLSKIFHVVGQRATDGDRYLYLWHREKKLIKKIGLADDKSIEQELGSVLGPSYQFFEQRVGIPAFLENPTQKEGGMYLRELDSQCRWYYRQALVHMAQNAPDYDSAPHKGQGVHVKRSTTAGTPTVYLVNGRDVYEGKYDPNDGAAWSALEGPSNPEGYIFDVGEHRTEEPWLPWVQSVDDLKAASAIQPQTLWERLHKALDKGWVFKNHALNAEFLTAHLLAATVCNAFRRQVIVGFHADTSSGKSRLLMGLIGGKDFPRIHLLASAIGKASFTAAGLRQEMNNKTRPLALDEFEDEGDNGKKTRTIVETLDMLRNSVGEDNTYSMGSRGGAQVIYHLNFFVFLAAIHKPRKVQDANRIVMIDMKREEGREDPVQILLQEFGEDGLTQLKRDLSVGLLPHISKIQRTYDEIEKEFSQAGSKPVRVDTRYFEALFPALTIMKMMGRDYKKFVNDFCKSNEDTLATTAGHTDSMQIFQWLIQSPAFTITKDDGKVRYQATLLQMLADDLYRDDINNSATGLYYDSNTDLLVVNWTMAIQSVLARHAKYGRETNIINLRSLAERAPNAVKTDVLQRSGALTNLRKYGLGGVQAHHLSAFNISDLMRDIRKSPAPLAVVKPVDQIQKKDVDDGDFGT